VREKAGPARPGSRAARLATALLIPVLLVGLSLYAQDLTMSAWNALVDYQSPYLFEIEPHEGTGRAATGGVLLVIVDGLRLDNSRQLPTFNWARENGCDLVCRVGQPSLSNPAAAVIPTGTWQEIHGVTTNWYEGEIRVDSLFHAARRSGLTTTVVAGKGWTALYGSSIGSMHEFDDSDADYDRLVYEKTMDILGGAEPVPDLMVVHFGGVDHDSHAYGGTSPEAMETARVIDGYIADILEAYGLEERTVILTSDHGHIDTGGHGGWEPEVLNVPLVLAGRAVRQTGPATEGTSPTGSAQVDIAPTIAALLGMSVPTHTVGTILDFALDVPTADLAADFIVLGRTRLAFSRAYTEAVAGSLEPNEALTAAAGDIASGGEYVDEAWVSLTAGDAAGALHQARMALEVMDEGRHQVKDLRLETERSGRLTTALVLAFLPLVPLIYLARNRWFKMALAGAVLYFAAYNLLFFVVHGFGLSLSVFNEESLMESFFAMRMLEAALIVLAIGLIFGVVAGIRRRYDGLELAEGAATLSYLVAYGLGVQIILFYYLWNVSFGWYIPDLAWGLKFYIDLLQFFPTGVASVLVVPLALLAAKLTSSLAGRLATPPVGAE